MTEMIKFKEECEWRQNTPNVEIIDNLDRWVRRIEEITDDSKAKFEALLTEKRKEYWEVVGTKPFMGWGLAQLDARLEEWKANNRLIKEHEETLTSKANKWKIAKKQQ